MLTHALNSSVCTKFSDFKLYLLLKLVYAIESGPKVHIHVHVSPPYNSVYMYTRTEVVTVTFENINLVMWYE